MDLPTVQALSARFLLLSTISLSTMIVPMPHPALSTSSLTTQKLSPRTTCGSLPRSWDVTLQPAKCQSLRLFPQKAQVVVVCLSKQQACGVILSRTTSFYRPSCIVIKSNSSGLTTQTTTSPPVSTYSHSSPIIRLPSSETRCLTLMVRMPGRATLAPIASITSQ